MIGRAIATCGCLRGPGVPSASLPLRTRTTVQKDAEGVYHINHMNSGESAWDSRDAPDEGSCLHMIVPPAETLGVDQTLRPQWQDVKDHLVYRNGRKAETRSGAAIPIDTTASETVVVVRFGDVPHPVSVN